MWCVRARIGRRGQARDGRVEGPIRVFRLRRKCRKCPPLPLHPTCAFRWHSLNPMNLSISFFSIGLCFATYTIVPPVLMARR